MVWTVRTTKVTIPAVAKKENIINVAVKVKTARYILLLLLFIE